MDTNNNQIEGASDKRAQYHFDNVFFPEPAVFESLLLFQIGDLSCKSGYVVGPHDQFCYEISYIVSGKGFMNIDGTTFQVKAGDIILNKPGEVHDLWADDQEPFRLFYVGFHFRFDYGTEHPLLPVRRMFDQRGYRIATNRYDVSGAFVETFEELLRLNTFSSFMIEAGLRRILVLTYRNFYEDWAGAYSPPHNPDRSVDVVYEIINYVDNNIMEITDLSQIAQKLNYSYPHISRKFTKETGMTIKDYYNRKRFDKAVALLQARHLTITQIAEILGYQSIHAFSKAFRKYFGLSPSHYLQFAASASKKEQ